MRTWYLRNEEGNLKVACYYVKTIIFNFIQLLLLIPLIILSIKTSQSYARYGSSIEYENTLPLIDNAIRAWLLFLVVLYGFVSFFAIRNSIRHSRSIQHFSWISFLSSWIPLTSIISIFIAYHERYLHYFINFECTNRNEGLQIDHKQLLNWLLGKVSSSKLIRNTLLFWITFIISCVGLGFIFSYHANEPLDNYFIFNTVSFFTQENNFLFWLFLVLFMFLNKKQLFSNNTYLLYATSYLLIVGIVANLMIGPYIYEKGTDKFTSAYPIIKFIWMHVINPTMLTWFCVNSLAQNYVKPIDFKPFIGNFVVYPIFYGIYLYSIPFMCHYSIYGRLTNLNPNMYNELNNHMGNPLWIFGCIGLVVIFILIGSLMRYINIKIVNNYSNYQGK